MKWPSQGPCSVLAGGAGIGLLKRLENKALFFLSDPDTRIDDRQGDDRVGATEAGMIRTPAAPAQAHLHANLSTRGELESVRKQVLDDLLKALGVTGEGFRQPRIKFDNKWQTLAFGDVAEAAFDGL